VQKAEIIFVIVPTPSEPNGRFSNVCIDTVIENLNKNDIAFPRMIVIVSTVMPGSMEQFRKKLSKRYTLCYNPEFIALGSVIQDMLNPDSILIGEEVKGQSWLLERFYNTIHEAPCFTMSYENAELAKLALNCYLTMKITFANQLAEICETVEDGDIEKVVRFIGSDKRIGSKYMVSGTGFGGPCFPRDNQAFMAAFGEKDLQKSVIKTNREIVDRIVQLAKRMIQDVEGSKIAVLGSTYKPETSVVENSQALEILMQLQKETNLEVVVYDPSHSGSVEEVLEMSDLAIIATPWKEFCWLDMKGMRHKRVLDCWRILINKKDCEVYKAIGVNS